jgi:phosphoglycolate phosphatase-like HAD superfamily hydrolase
MSGIGEVLERLHPLTRMAVVTSCSQEHFAAIHRNTGLAKYFDFVLTAESYAKAKGAYRVVDSMAELAVELEHLHLTQSQESP